MKTIYDFKNYKEFLNAQLSSSSYGRGVKTEISKYLGVSTSFLSAVLHGSHELAPEHALKTAEFLKLNKEETDYLMTLTQRDRSGSTSLHKYYQHILDEKLKAREEIISRVPKNEKQVTEKDLIEFFSVWYHSAIQMCIRNPKYQTIHSIMKALKLEVHEVKQSLTLLERMGFAKIKQDTIIPLEARLHTPPKELSTKLNHSHWRMAANRSLDHRKDQDFHYTLVMSLDQETQQYLRKVLLKTIEDLEPKIAKAKDEKVCTLTIDLFDVC